MTHFTVTANRLQGGEVLYRINADEWSPKIQDSLLAETKDLAEEWLERAETKKESLKIVGPYVMRVQCSDGKITPLGQREMIRAKGPTVHPQFQKLFPDGSHV